MCVCNNYVSGKISDAVQSAMHIKSPARMCTAYVCQLLQPDRVQIITRVYELQLASCVCGVVRCGAVWVWLRCGVVAPFQDA